jgi:hypothetical protein
LRNKQSEGGMRVRSIVLLGFLVGVGAGNGLFANEIVDRAHKFEDAGDSAAAKDVYAKALRSRPNDPEVLAGYAQVLERYKDPSARDAWRKSAAAWQAANRPQDAAPPPKPTSRPTGAPAETILNCPHRPPARRSRNLFRFPDRCGPSLAWPLCRRTFSLTMFCWRSPATS